MARKRSPNIVLIICHDLGRRLGCYGIANLRTPAIDALASAGVVCERYFASAPLCSPSRGSMMTGLYPHTNGLMGLVNRGWDMPDTYPTLAQLLLEHGYRTLLFGVQHEKTDWRRMGYEEYHRQFLSDAATENFCAWLRARQTGARFFACIGFFEAHRPFVGQQFKPDNPRKVSVPPYLPDMAEVRHDLADMHGMIFAIDKAVAQILTTLLETGYEENTLVAFTTDHGIAFPRAKSTLYDSGLEAAMILRWPAGFKGGQRAGRLLSNVDLMPTLLEAAGAKAPKNLHGRSFLPLLRGEKYTPRTEVFAEKTWHDHYDPMRGVRTESFKYIQSFPDEVGAPPTLRPRLILPADVEESYSRLALEKLNEPHLTPRPEEELYDLERDPGETRNVIDDPAYAEALTDLRWLLVEWMDETKDPLNRGPIPCPDSEMQMA